MDQVYILMAGHMIVGVYSTEDLALRKRDEFHAIDGINYQIIVSIVEDEDYDG